VPRKVTDARLNRAVTNYIARHRPSLDDEIQFFQRRSSLTEAIDDAARARGPRWNKHPHQRRIQPKKLRALSLRLKTSKDKLRRARDFRQIHEIVKEASQGIWIAAELTVYDTACRIAAYRGLRPQAVYLHRGTRAGAQLFGFDGRRETMEKREFPSSMQQLSPAEIEDCLCIFKGFLAGEVTSSRNVCACGSAGGCPLPDAWPEKQNQQG
jgi:hypothetical protein